jgi:uncharacterized RDD family membrane protein YckC
MGLAVRRPAGKLRGDVSTPPPPPPPGPPEGQPPQPPQPPQQPPTGGWQPRPPDTGTGPYQQAPPQPSWAGGPAYAPAVATGQLSGFWRRFGAYIIDAIIVGVASSIIQAIISAIVRASTDMNGYYVRSGLISLVLGLIYFGYMWSQFNGQTLGYMALGIRLVRQDGGPISFGLALGRYLVIYLSFLIDLIPAIISAFMIAFGSQKKAIQDYICGTLVVRT